MHRLYDATTYRIIKHHTQVLAVGGWSLCLANNVKACTQKDPRNLLQQKPKHYLVGADQSCLARRPLGNRVRPSPASPASRPALWGEGRPQTPAAPAHRLGGVVGGGAPEPTRTKEWMPLNHTTLPSYSRGVRSYNPQAGQPASRQQSRPRSADAEIPLRTRSAERHTARHLVPPRSGTWDWHCKQPIP